MDQDIRCGTCKHFQPLELEGWGSCTLKELWLIRPQEVPADLHACEGRGSHWNSPGSQTVTVEPMIPVMNTVPKSTPGRRTPPPEELWPRSTTPPALNPGIPVPQPAKGKLDQKASRPGVILLVLGVIGLALILPVLILDLLIIVPGVPEISIVLIPLSLLLTVVGAIRYFGKRKN